MNFYHNSVDGVGGIEDWLKSAASIATEAGRVRTAVRDVTRPSKLKPAVVVQSPSYSGGIDLDNTLKLYLAAGGVALLGLLYFMRKQ